MVIMSIYHEILGVPAPPKDFSHLSLSELFGYRQACMDLGYEDKVKAVNDEIDARYNQSLQDSLESQSPE
jgi:hypothetical protein